jgi:K+-sensing histidine kinase KdpD
MSAFVVHDLKNLVAQMSLMLRNAERHKDNPEFQADMLDTVRHVEERMRGLMAQLMEKTPINQRKPVALKGLLKHVMQSKRMFIPCPVLVKVPRSGRPGPCGTTRAHPGHIVQNALDATPEHGSVSVELSQERNQACITVQDTGRGCRLHSSGSSFSSLSRQLRRAEWASAPTRHSNMCRNWGSLTVQRCWRGTRFDIRLPIAASVRNDGNEAMAN